MRALLSLLARLAGLIASIAIVLMMLHVTTEVVLRVAFRAPASGTIEIVSYFYMVAAVFLGIFVAAWQNAHIRVDVIANLFSRPLQRLTDLLAELITVVFFAFFAWGLARTALQKTHQHEAVDAVFAHLTVWPTRWVAVAGLVLALCAAAWRLARMLAGADTRDAVSDFVVDDDEAIK